jgi:non-specific protein-tyrosine kinase
VDLQAYLRAVRRRWRWLAIVTLLSVAGAAFVTSRQTPVYATTLKLFVSGESAGDAETALASGFLSEQRVRSYAALIETAEVRTKVRTKATTMRLDGEPSIRATPVTDTVLITVTVTDVSPERAQAWANAVGTEFPAVVESLERPPSGGASPIKATVIERAFLPESPSFPNPRLNLTLGLMLGLMAGAGFALLAELLDNSVKGESDLVALTSGAPALGVIGFDPEAARNQLVAQEDPHSQRAEQFRQLRTNIQFIGLDDHVRTIVVTSSMPAEGKSRVSANLAVTIASGGQRVCLVDADLRRPMLAEYLGVERGVGLTSVLIGAVTMDEALQPWGDNANLKVLPTGPIPPNPSEILGSQAMVDMLETLKERFDVVVLDSPPLLPVTDPAILSAVADGAILVVRANRTTRDQVRKATAVLAAVNAKLMGSVLNFAPDQGSGAYERSYNYRGLDPEVSLSHEALRPSKRRKAGAPDSPAEAPVPVGVGGPSGTAPGDAAQGTSGAAPGTTAAGATTPGALAATALDGAPGPGSGHGSDPGSAADSGEERGPVLAPPRAREDIAAEAMRAVQQSRSRWRRSEVPAPPERRDGDSPG